LVSPINETVDTRRRFLEGAGTDTFSERGEEQFAYVFHLEGVEVAALQREVLDHRPVERGALFSQHGEGGLEWFHVNQRERPA
jgi:hypothetical protein